MCRTIADAALIEAAQRIAPLVRACRDEGECERRLPAQVLAAMHEARLFRMYIPKALDGLEIDPIKSMIVVEEIACEIVEGGQMSVELNHKIIPAKDKWVSAKFL
jgi:alkylation response protein AidB-like acyl-CoA dehydrogenase